MTRNNGIGPFGDLTELAEQHRRLLRDSHVTVINLVGPKGCGKTSLIASTMAALGSSLKIGAAVCGRSQGRDGEFLIGLAGEARRVIELVDVRTPCRDLGCLLTALSTLDVQDLDVLFTENISSTLVPLWAVVPRLLHVAMFSVDTSDDRPRALPHLSSQADAVVLNKVDLLPKPGFDLARYRAAVTALNPSARQVECSVLKGTGLEAWTQWLDLIPPLPLGRASAWFG